MTVPTVEWKLTRDTGSEWLRGIQGVDKPKFIGRIGQKVLGIFCPPAGFISATWTNLRMLFPTVTIWISSCVTVLPHVLLDLHVLSCAWSYIPSSGLRCSAQTCWWTTYRCHKWWLTDNVLPSDEQLLFQYCPPIWNTRGRMILAPHWKTHWSI